MKSRTLGIDSFDLRLLSLLEEDARQTLSQMAKKLRSSQQVVSYRMKLLESKGVVGGYYSLLDIGKLGYTSYRTLLRLSNVSKKTHSRIITYLQKHSNVLWIVDCGGRWDLLVNFLAKNVVQYNEFLQEFRKAFPSHIQNYDVLITVEGIYFGRDYLINSQRKDSWKIPTKTGKP